MSRHTKDPVCPLCQEKMALAHPTLQEWWKKIKAEFPDAHVSWTFRDKEMQELFFEDGRTRCRWPNSKHNRKPAEAMDLFQLRPDGMAAWQRAYFVKIAEWLKAQNCPLQWSGTWTTFREYDHFEIKQLIPAGSKSQIAPGASRSPE